MHFEVRWHPHPIRSGVPPPGRSSPTAGTMYNEYFETFSMAYIQIRTKASICVESTLQETHNEQVKLDVERSKSIDNF